MTFRTRSNTCNCSFFCFFSAKLFFPKNNSIFVELLNYLPPLKTVIKALNDATRREILELLKEKDRTAGEIADHFSFGKPTISHHLDLLRQANLVTSWKEGQYVVYALNTTVLDELVRWLLVLSTDKTKQPNL